MGTKDKKTDNKHTDKHHDHHSVNTSSALLWEITRNNSSYLVKRKTGGGCRLSRDPLNTRNKHAKKYSGVIHEKAVGLTASEKGGLTLHTKKKDGTTHSTSYHPAKTNRKSYATIVNSTAKKGYRSDLRQDAVARASQILRSQRKPPKEKQASKPRGVKARKAAADKAANQDVD